MMSPSDGFAAVILAAGSSSRLGRPKQTVRFRGETLLDRAVRTTREGGATEVVIVLGAFADAVQESCALQDCHIVRNPDWQAGMGSSIRTGVATLRTQAGVIVMVCDMPFVSAAHLRLLVRSGEVTASRYGGVNGIPAYFPYTYFPKLVQLGGNVTAKMMLQAADSVDLSGFEADIDTEADMEAALARSNSAG